MAQIKIKFHRGGFIQLEAEGYPDEICHEATRPYSIRFGGKQTTVETGGDNSVTLATHSQSQQIKNRG